MAEPMQWTTITGVLPEHVSVRATETDTHVLLGREMRRFEAHGRVESVLAEIDRQLTPPPTRRSADAALARFETLRKSLASLDAGTTLREAISSVTALRLATGMA